MPSPDVAGYLGLELVPGVDATQLLAEALANMALSFPTWVPREGNTEVVVLEEVAAITEELVYAINLLPAGITELLLRILGEVRDQGQPPTVGIYVEVGAAYIAGANTVPAGTVFEVSNGLASLNFTTINDVTSTPGNGAMYLTAYAGEATAILNGTTGPGTVNLLDSLEFVDYVSFDDNVSGGRAPEDGAAFLDRAIPTLSRLTTTLVRPVDIEAYTATLSDVVRVKVIDLYTSTLPNPPGSSPGYVTVYVAGDAGTALTGTRRTAIRAQIAERMHAGVTVAVSSPTVTVVDVNVTVLRYNAADDGDVMDAVTTAIGAYINPNTWPWLNVVRVNELIAAADGAAGVDTVLAVTQQRTTDPSSLGAADLTIPGLAPLAKLGTVTVTVVEAP